MERFDRHADQSVVVRPRLTTAVGVAGGEVDVQVPVLLEVGVERDPEQAALAQQRLVQVVDSSLLSD